jgi:glycosyltransferase involved in cell wall biosynthesis
MEEKVLIIESSTSPVLIYIGSENSVEKGAIGTHSAGIFNALSASGHFQRTIFIGGRPTAETNIPLKADENFLFDSDIAEARTIAGRMRRRYVLLRKISDRAKFLLSHHPGRCFVVYTRYGLFLTFFLLLILRKVLAKSKVTLISEYNDITIDQLVFVNKFRSSLFGKIVRTNPVVLRLIELSEAYVFSKSTIVVVMTDKLREYVLRLSKSSKTLVLPNAASIDLIAQSKVSSKHEMRKELGLAPDCFYLAHIGTLTFWDGLDFLLNGIALCRRHADLRLTIIGFGSALDSIRRQVSDLDLKEKVSFFPAMPHEQAYRYLLASDVVPILKTITAYNLSPIKYYETLAAGKPLIATDIPYINEIGKFPFGKVVSCPPSASETAQAIDYFYENRGKLNAWKHDILAYASKYHTWDIRAGKLLREI